MLSDVIIGAVAGSTITGIVMLGQTLFRQRKQKDRREAEVHLQEKPDSILNLYKLYSKLNRLIRLVDAERSLEIYSQSEDQIEKLEKCINELTAEFDRSSVFLSTIQ